MTSKNGRTENITTAGDFSGDLAPFLDAYTYQPDLTGRPDNLDDADFTQELVNEIVLWKVNRYVSLTPRILQDIGGGQGRNRTADASLFRAVR